MPDFHPLADLFPMMDEAALAELAADVKAESQREPIFLWQGQIIDGRNRYRACQIAGVEPIFKPVEFPRGEAEALAYVLSRNLKRRHLTIAQRAVIAAKVANMRQGRPEKTGTGAGLITQGRPASVPDGVVPQAKAAEMLDVSERSVRNAKAVIDRGSPELVAAVESGETSLRKAAETVRHAAEPAPPDPAVLAMHAEANNRRQTESNARINNRDIRIVFGQLADAEQRRFLAEALRLEDVLAWLLTALDSECRRVATAAFGAIRSTEEKLKHEDAVRAWLEAHEHGDASEPCDDAPSNERGRDDESRPLGRCEDEEPTLTEEPRP